MQRYNQPFVGAPVPVAPTPTRTPVDVAPAAPLADTGGHTVTEPAINVTSVSSGGSGFGMVPDIPPEYLSKIMNTLSKYSWSAEAGGYLTKGDAANANSYYNKFGAGGGGDPTANKAMGDMYAVIGSFPTKPVTTLALQKYYADRPNEAQNITHGPSYNETLQKALEGPYGDLVKQAGFGPTYTGPYGFGRQRPGYNEYGAYHPGYLTGG